MDTNQINVKLGGNAKAFKAGEQTFVKLHDTYIVRIYPDKIILNTGGFFTSTTKKIMNLVSEKLDLGFRVFQQDSIWKVTYKEREFSLVTGHLEIER